MRNDPSDKTRVVYLCNREANAINGDRSFFHDVTRISPIQADLKSPTTGLLFQGDDRCRTINVPLHEMAPESGSDCESTLQIDSTAMFEGCQIGAGNRFLEQIEE